MKLYYEIIIHNGFWKSINYQGLFNKIVTYTVREKGIKIYIIQKLLKSIFKSYESLWLKIVSFWCI